MTQAPVIQFSVGIYLFSFVEKPLKFIIAELSIRKLGSSSVLIIRPFEIHTSLFIDSVVISTDEDTSLNTDRKLCIINLRGFSTKLNEYIVFTMQTYKKLIWGSNYR